ncbi:MAG: flagellar biosynthetic protein FliR [Acidobacteriota bacterium]|jgi:flagellar biosynthetic protein FliR|nr:flagellar biosynthetic protein FliR [Acidobacteriota bacterium]
MDISFPIAEVVRFAIVLARLGGIMVSAPFFSGGSIPVTIRVAFSLLAAWVLAPSLPLGSLPAGLSLGSLTGTILMEVVFGLVLGFVANCVFAGLQFAGQIISFQMGFSVINLIDPQTEVDMPVFSFFANYVGILLFLLVNGHHWFLLAVHDSFGVLPVGGFVIGGALVEQFVGMTATIFAIGVKIAGPVIIVTTIVDIVIGIIGRTAPQINLLVVGMPLKLLAGFACLSFSFYFLPRQLEGVFLSLSRTLHALASGAS